MSKGSLNKMMGKFEMYLSGMSIPEVSEATGISLSTLRFQLLKKGILRTREEGVRSAAKRGRLGSGLRGKARTFTEEHKKNISKSRKGKGKGYSLKSSGYYEITMGENKFVSLHRAIMENT